MSDQYDVVAAVQTAIQMEKDGRSFYQRAAAETDSEMGRKIFESLAEDERLHLETFQKIFEDRLEGEEWDELTRSSRKYANIPVFPKDLSSVEGPDPDTNELDALNLAMNAEKEAIEFYQGILENTPDVEVRKIIEEIIHHEKNHYLLLNEEFTHLSSTGYWYQLDPLGG